MKAMTASASARPQTVIGWVIRPVLTGALSAGCTEAISR